MPGGPSPVPTKTKKMAILDEELMQDAQDDARAVAYISSHLPQELQEIFDEEKLYYFLDLIVEYYAQSGILDAEPDKDGFVDIDGEEVAAYVAKKAKKEGMGEYSPEDLLFVVQAEMDYEFGEEEDEA